MECLICRQKIEHGERIFAGSIGVCRTDPNWEDGCWDFCSSDDSEELVGTIHLSCLQNPTGVARTTNTMVLEPVEEKAIVKRSDALGLLGF